MGGSLAESWSRVLKWAGHERRELLMAGMAAGFGAVFGTPLAGAVFAMEVLSYRGIEWPAWLPCLVAALSADWCCRAWGIQHAHYELGAYAFSTSLLLKLLLASACFGMVGAGFAVLQHRMKDAFGRVKEAWLRPVLGAVLLMALTAFLGTRSFLGLGTDSILRAFSYDGAAAWDWAWKTLFTGITLASGFKGGEVTPLFFIGATLGNSLSVLLQAPCGLLAGLGLVAVFAGASNTPLACAIMGAELFGWPALPYTALACLIAWACSGKGGIYKAQRK
jgi:H+/Cl- antiporter ClcA